MNDIVQHMSEMNSHDLIVTLAQTPAELACARQLFTAYAASIQERHCFPNFADELSNLDQIYGAPHGGLFLAWAGNLVAGCCAFRPLPDTDHLDACEMKRLYVPDEFRGMGIGHRLVATVMEAAQASGYSCMLLDTLDEMEAARALYVEMGFIEIPPYIQSPVPGAHHLKVVL